ncbi:MAG: hypothetical protein AB1638_02695 [Nitrospirota bacterium]
MITRKLRIILQVAMVMQLLKSSYAIAYDISLHGFFQGNYSRNSASANPDGGDFKWAEERLQLKLDANKEPFSLFIKADAFFDHIDEKGDLELREGYVAYTANKWDVRAGRQIITWGVGDLIFINDVFPKDYEAFFAGRPLEYLKKGVDSVKIEAYPGFASFEFVFIPFFEPNNLPDPERFWLFDPMPSVTKRVEKKPITHLDNTEIAIRVYRDVDGFDASIYFYKGFFRQPSMIPDNLFIPTKLTMIFPRLSVYGASMQGRALDGVVSLEAGYYDSRQDRNGIDPFIPNSQLRFLIGYQRQMWEDFTMGIQYYGEYMYDYFDYKRTLLSGFPRERKLHELFTIRFTQFFSHQTLRLSFFSFYSPSDGDYMLNPEIKYSFSDHIWAAVGGNIFGRGERWSQFGQLSRDDNIYLQFRYEF